jgi:ATP-dependent DNA ligase
MLAHTFDFRKPGRVRFPCFTQPKIDGVRCLVYRNEENEVVACSRTGHRFTTVQHILDALSTVFRDHPNIVLDGELYSDVMPFEELVGKIKQKSHEPVIVIHYHVYDHVSNEPFYLRTVFLKSLFPLPVCIRWVDTHEINNIVDIRTRFLEYTDKGYEGIMIRNRDGKYTTGGRSYDLQKYKEFCEDEFEIVDFREGEGRDEGACIWVCKTTQGKPFSVRPKGSMELRRRWFRDGTQYIGRLLTVRYQGFGRSGVPRFPVGRCVREF